MTKQPVPGVHENFAASAIDAPTSEPRDRFLAAFERAIHECKLMANEPVEGRPDRDKYFYRGVAAAVDTLEIFLAREKSKTPPPRSHLMGPDFGSHGSATAMIDVIAERLRQQEKEGWTPEHDDQHNEGQIAAAAACYAHASYLGNDFRFRAYWPWSDEWWKPKSPRENLVRAAALLVAEIERLDRASLATTEGSTE